MNKDRFLFFENFRRIANSLPDDLRLQFYDALTAYVFDEVEPEDPIIKSLIIAISPSLDKEDKRGGNHNPSGQNQYSKDKQENNEAKIAQSGQNNNMLGQSEVKNRSKEVKVGQCGQSFLETETRNGNKKQENIPPSESKLSSVGIEETREKIAQPPIKKFIKPTVDEVRSYCLERKNGIDPEKWFDFYQSKGWRVGSQPMKDWKAAVRTWERRDSYQTLPKKQNDDDDFYRKLEAL